MFNFEKLDVWQKSIGLADLTYQLTKTFPVDERFGLTNQMRRAAVSISSNIAEGCSRGSKADFRHFIEIAVGSAFELVSHARIAQAQGWLNAETNAKIYESALEIVRMLSGLRDSLKD
jgi:four helix bundle protein